LTPNQWFIMTLYGFVAALFAYVVAIITRSPLASFALIAGYQILMFIVSAIQNLNLHNN